MTVGATDNIERPDSETEYAELKVDDLQPAADISRERYQRRLAIWRGLQDRFLESRNTNVTVTHDTAYESALRLMGSPVAKAFDLDQESEEVRDAYGRGRFGQGCLMARRLLESEVPFVEVSLGDFAGGNVGWDTHQQNFPNVKRLSEQLDQGWGTLMDDLAQRGLLETTTILWMGEFGRTPQINAQAGRDHFPTAWSCVFAGGGIQGGHAYGATTEDGMEVKENPVTEGDILASLCKAVGVDPDTENMTPQGRPIKIAEGNVLPFIG